MSPAAKYAIAAVAGALAGIGFGKAILQIPASPEHAWATGVVKLVAVQFIGTIGAVVVFIVVMRVLRD